MQGKISEHIFGPNGSCCVYYPSNIFCNRRGFENSGIPLGYSPVFTGPSIQFPDVLRPIVRE